MTFLSIWDLRNLSSVAKNFSTYEKEDYVWKAICIKDLGEYINIEQCYRQFQEELESSGKSVSKFGSWKHFYIDFTTLSWLQKHKSPDLVIKNRFSIVREEQGKKLWNIMRTQQGWKTGFHQWQIKLDFLDTQDSNSWKVCVGVGDELHVPGNENGGSWNGGTGTAYGLACYNYHLVSGSPTQAGATASPSRQGATGDVITLQLDLDKGKLEFWVNAKKLSIYHNIVLGGTYYPLISMSQKHKISLIATPSPKSQNSNSEKVEEGLAILEREGEDMEWTVSFNNASKIGNFITHTLYSWDIFSHKTGTNYRFKARFSELTDFKSKFMSNDSTLFPEKQFFSDRESVISQRSKILTKWLEVVFNSTTLREQICKTNPLQKIL